MDQHIGDGDQCTQPQAYVMQQAQQLLNDDQVYVSAGSGAPITGSTTLIGSLHESTP